MRKAVIAVDIDDVLAANAKEFVRYSNKKWGTRLTVEDYQEHWGEMWGVDLAEVEKRSAQYHQSGTIGKYEHFSEAKEVLVHLAAKHSLVVLTSRRREIVNETTEWINLYFEGIFSEVHYAGMWDTITEESHLITKGGLCKQIGADYLIDDQPKHCFAAADAGIPSLLFGDYPWNRAVRLPERVVRAHSWDDVREYFDEEFRK
jgi:uncharacterized HAD superfamily protein